MPYNITKNSASDTLEQKVMKSSGKLKPFTTVIQEKENYYVQVEKDLTDQELKITEANLTVLGKKLGFKAELIEQEPNIPMYVWSMTKV